jgi:GNAT superfamily N-acetyltransferase
MARIVALATLPRAEIEPLVAASLAEGHSMVARLRDDWIAGRNRFNRPGEALYGAYVEGALAGICGRNIDPYRDDPAIARVRHLYVLPGHRRLGLGRALVAAVIDGAAGRFTGLSLRTRDPGAKLFYETLGFAHVGEETTTHFLALRGQP